MKDQGTTLAGVTCRPGPYPTGGPMSVYMTQAEFTRLDDALKEGADLMYTNPFTGYRNRFAGCTARGYLALKFVEVLLTEEV